MHVIVVGAGIVGVCTAYWLNRNGIQVTVLDRRSGVAQESSFGNAGIVAPAYASPWASPGMPGKMLSYLFKTESPLLFRPSADPALWRWTARWLGHSRLERFNANKLTMHRIARYSQAQLDVLREEHDLEFERRVGYLQLLRSERDLDLSRAARQIMQDNGIRHALLSVDQTTALEPCLQDALQIGTPLAGAIHFPDDESGNCPLVAKLIAGICERAGVRFVFNTTVRSLSGIQGAVTGVRLADGKALAAQAVVVASGSDSTHLLAPSGIHLPIYPVKGYAANAALRADVIGPKRAFVDEAYQTTVTPLGQRLRIAGTAELGSRSPGVREKALRTLIKVAQDWLPGMLDLSLTTWWSGTYPMTPDGPPVLGATHLPGLYLNTGHGSQGWCMAAGSGRIVADLIAGKTPEIDIQGLDISRYTRKN